MDLLWNTPERLRALLCRLVGWSSVTESAGERAFAEHLAGALRETARFAQQPELVRLFAVDGSRSYVTALHHRPGVRDTIVLISHFDTVDTAEYGPLEALACDPERLTAAMREVRDELDAQAVRDLDSGEWLFGRGTMDMKAGLALHLALVERAGAEDWPINLLLLAVPDEEVNSAGMRAAVDGLLDLAREHDLRYVLFLNGEPSFPAHPGDDRHHVYSGSIGKILPSALCVGRETHAGTPLAGLTSTWIASHLTQAMEFADEFRESVHGEATPLPVVLGQRDLRDGYSTQTTSRTSVLCNVFVMEQAPDQVMDAFEQVARSAAGRANEEYRRVCEREDVQMVGEIRVLRFEQVEQLAVDKLGREEVDGLVARAVQDGPADLRERAMHVVDVLLGACPEAAPAIVLLFAPPFYPAVNSTGDDLVQACIELVQERALERFGREIVQTHFFNGISDLSYVNWRGDDAGWRAYERNAPGFGEIYSVPFAGMRELDAPVLNVGPLGMDPHMRTERVHVRSAFEELPALLAELVEFVATRPSPGDARRAGY